MDEVSFENVSCLQMFLLFFPFSLRMLVVKSTNKNLEKNGHKAMTHGEFLRFLGIWLFMATIGGYGRKEYWENYEVRMDKGAPY